MTDQPHDRDEQQPEPVERAGFPWVRPEDDAAAATLGSVPTTPDDVAGSAMRAVVEIDRAIASLEAMRTQLLAGLGHHAVETTREHRLESHLALRDVAAELGQLERRSDRTVEAEIDGAMADVEHWPATMRAWGAGEISRAHARVITDVGGALPDPEARAAFEAAVLAAARATTPGRLRALARREAERHQPRPLTERHREAREGRRVDVTDLDDGMAVLRATIPGVLAHGIVDRLTRIARSAPAVDPRTADQRRADAFGDLLLTGEATAPGIEGIRAQVQVVIPATALTGEGEGAALQSGAPVDAETARTLAGSTARWIRLFTDPVRGHVLRTDAYVPTKRMRRYLAARDRHCRFPGCAAKAEYADIDHTHGWAEGGTTRIDNLAHLCRRHHVMKSVGRWKVRQVREGVLEWRSPAGHLYVDEPVPIGPRFRSGPASGPTAPPTSIWDAPPGDPPQHAPF